MGAMTGADETVVAEPRARQGRRGDRGRGRRRPRGAAARGRRGRGRRPPRRRGRGRPGATHLFECRTPGYFGWRWSVTVARASRQKSVTVDEIVLIPGPEASSRRSGCPTASGSSPATCRPATCFPWPTTTRAWSRRTPSATTRSTPTRSPDPHRRQGSRPGRVRTLSPEGPSSPRSGGTTATPAPRRPSRSPRRSRARPVASCPDLRLARRVLRRLRQRRRQRRRPRRGLRPRLRRPLGGPARQRHEPLPLPDQVIDDLDDELETF